MILFPPSIQPATGTKAMGSTPIVFDLRIFFSFNLLTYLKTSNHLTDINLLVSTFEVSSVMATSCNPKSHINITLQHPITCIHFLSGWLPSQYLLLHDWAVSGKVHTVKTDVIDKTHPFLVQPVEKKELVMISAIATFKDSRFAIISDKTKKTRE